MRYAIQTLLLALLLVFTPNVRTSQGESTGQHAADLETQAQVTSFEWTVDSVRRSLGLYLEAAELWRQSGETAKRCSAMRGASQQKLMLGDSEGAFAVLLNTLQLEETSPADISGKMQTLSLLSRTALLLGRSLDCKTYYNQALSLIDQTQDPMALGEAYYSASLYSYEEQAIDQAVQLNDKALEQFRLAQNKSRETEVLIEQSYAYMLRRDLATGVQFAHQALTISEQINDRRGQVGALIAIGNANITMGETRVAFDAYQRADGLLLDDLDHMKKAQIANGLGSLYEKYGDWRQSLNYRERALQLFLAEKNKPGQLYTLISLGRLANLTNNYEAAVTYLNQGEQIARELEDQFGLAKIWIEQGNVSFTRGQNDACEDYYRRALRIFLRLNDRLYVALVRSYLGELEERRGNLNASTSHYKAALKLNSDLKNLFGEADTLYQLAHIDSLLNRPTEALRLVEESLQISETLRGNIANSRLRTSYFSEVQDRFSLLVNVLMRIHQQSPSSGYNALALQAAERARARTLVDTLRMMGADFYTGADDALIEREKRVRIDLTLKSDEITNLLNSANPRGTILEKLKNEIDSLSAEYDDIKARLRESSLQYRTLAEPGDFDLPKFQEAVLDDDTLLIEFFLGKEQSFLWLASNTEVFSYELPPQSIIEEKINRVTELIRDRDLRPDEELEEYQRRLAAAEQEYWRDAQELSNLLFSQAADKLGKKRLVVVADKQLHYIPFAALPKPQRDGTQSSPEPLIVDHEIVCQPSANALLLLEKHYAESPSAKTLLALADPVFSRDDARLRNIVSNEADSSRLVTLSSPQRGDQVFLRLPATRQEAESISSYLGPGQATILTGEAASRETLLHINFAGYKIVHLATHGVYDEETPELSGIVLSQFDKRGNPQNGYLRLSDIYQLSMPVDLVVLSACSSGQGKIVRGEGIIGLTRAFMQTGCKSVLSSLWKVDDAATAQLMNNYYEALIVENSTPAAALRQAQLEMWKSPEWHSPFYWAAFNLHGEFRWQISAAKNPARAYFEWGLCLFLLTGFVLFVTKRLIVRLRTE